MALKKRFLWIIRRHPILYFVRYVLLSKNRKSSSGELEVFGDVNQVIDIPQLFHDVNKQIGLNPDLSHFEKAKQIGRFLRSNTKVGPAVSLSAVSTLSEMLYGNGGVCSDFALVFNIFCLLNDIPSREYNSVDKLYNAQYGHAFNEIYDDALKQWIAIDIHKGIYFVDADQRPESVDSLFENLRKGNLLHFIYYSDYQPARPERLIKVYSKETIVYLVSNYRIKDIDNILEQYSAWPTFAIVFMMILKRKNYRFVFLADNYKKLLFPKFYH